MFFHGSENQRRLYETFILLPLNTHKSDRQEQKYTVGFGEHFVFQETLDERIRNNAKTMNAVIRNPKNILVVFPHPPVLYHYFSTRG
jgi:hypothetical protein